MGLLILGCLLLFSGCRETRFWNQSGAPVAESESGGSGTPSRFFSRLPFGQKEDTSVVLPVPTPGNYSNVAADLVTLGNEALRDQRLADAERAFSDAVLEDDSCWEAHHGLAMIADLQQDWQASERHYKRALGSQRENASLLSDIGYSYILQSRYAEANDYLTRAIEIEPGLQQAHLNLALLELKRGDRTAAMNRVNTLFPNSGDALQVFTDLQDQVGLQSEQRSDESLQQIAPDLPAGLQQFQEIARRGREREEKQRYAQSVANSPAADELRFENAGFPEDEPPMLNSPRARYPGEVQIAEQNPRGADGFTGPVEAPPAATPLISRENGSVSPPDVRDSSVPVSSRREVKEPEEQQNTSDGQVTQTGFQYYDDYQNSAPDRSQVRSQGQRLSTNRQPMSGDRNVPGPQYRDDSRYSSGPQYRDDSRYSSGPQYRDDSRYSSGAQYRDDSRYSSGAQYRDDSRYSSGPEYRDDSRYNVALQSPRESRPLGGLSYEGRNQYVSGTQFEDERQRENAPWPGQYRPPGNYQEPQRQPLPLRSAGPTQLRQAIPVNSGAGNYAGDYSGMPTDASQSNATPMTDRPPGASPGYSNPDAMNAAMSNRTFAASAVAGQPAVAREQLDANGLNVGPGVLFPVGANGEGADDEDLNVQLHRILANANARNLADAPAGVANGTGINGAAWSEVESYIPAERPSQQWMLDNSHLNQGRFVDLSGQRNQAPAAAPNPLSGYRQQLRSLQQTYGGQPSGPGIRTP